MSGIRELLRVSGLADPVYWAGHYLSLQTMLLLLEALMLVIVYWGDTLLKQTNPLLMFLGFVMYGNGTSIHAIFLSCFLISSEFPIA